MDIQVLGIGEVVLDKQYFLKQFPHEDEKIQPVNIDHTIGGPVCTALVLLSRLGIHTNLVASIGRDKFGGYFMKKIRKERIVFHPVFQQATKNHTIINSIETGSRTIIRDTTQHDPIMFVDPVLVRSADMVIFDRHEPLALEEVVRMKRKDTKIILDPSTEVSDKIAHMFDMSDYIIIPIESLDKHVKGGMSIGEKMIRLFKRHAKPLIVTASKHGCLLYDGQDIDLVPSYQIKAIDSLGAGDIFRGGFAYGILQQWSLRKSCEFGNLVAALQCTKMGNMNAVPTLEEIKQFESNAVLNIASHHSFIQNLL